jgi:hypothetical protein
VRLDGAYESTGKNTYISRKADIMVIFAAGVGISVYTSQIEEWMEAKKKVEVMNLID